MARSGCAYHHAMPPGARAELPRRAEGDERAVRCALGRGAKKKTEDKDEAGAAKEDKAGAAAGGPARASPKKTAPKDEGTAAKAKASPKTAVPKDEVIEVKDMKKAQVHIGGLCARVRGTRRGQKVSHYRMLSGCTSVKPRAGPSQTQTLANPEKQETKLNARRCAHFGAQDAPGRTCALRCNIQGCCLFLKIQCTVARGVASTVWCDSANRRLQDAAIELITNMTRRRARSGAKQTPRIMSKSPPASARAERLANRQQRGREEGSWCSPSFSLTLLQKHLRLWPKSARSRHKKSEKYPHLCSPLTRLCYCGKKAHAAGSSQKFPMLCSKYARALTLENALWNDLSGGCRGHQLR